MPGLEEKVAFLSRPESYPESTKHVETKETHMSWIFLTDTQAWKLKKPSWFDHLDLRRPEARRRHCDEELRLNRRLASNVYRRVVPLIVRPGRKLQLDGAGIVDDWLVCMRRLPADRMLDQAIARQNWSDEDLRRVGLLLAHFYSGSAPFPMRTETYLKQLTAELESSRADLTREGLNGELIESRINSALTFIERHFDILDERVRAGRIVEGHGDLRPEHICLEHQSVIIDCLEFNRDLRIIDPASELMFLRLECERLGAASAGDMIFETYRTRSGDRPAENLLAFYRTYHAAVRAKVAIWHLQDLAIRDVQKWITRAEQYLEMAA